MNENSMSELTSHSIVTEPLAELIADDEEDGLRIRNML